MSTGVAERVSPEEVRENNLFLDAVMETAVMKVNNMLSPVRGPIMSQSDSRRPVHGVRCRLGLGRTRSVFLRGDVSAERRRLEI